MGEGLILVRHGETEDNVNGIAQGWSDSPLTDRGRQQVARLARRLRRLEPSSVWSSTLPRAIATAEAIATELGLELTMLDDLREMNCGRWEGQSFRDVRVQDREHYERWRSDPSVPCPGGESFRDVTERMRRAVDTILEREGPGRPVVVSHGTAIRLVTCDLVGFPIEGSYKLLQDNTAINVLDRRGDQFLLRTWNDSSHCLVEED